MARGGYDFPTDPTEAFSNIFARLKAIERKNLSLVDPNEKAIYGETIWSQPDVLIVSVASPRWYARKQRLITSLFFSLDVAGGSDTVVTMLLNGSGFASYTIPSGQNTLEVVAGINQLPALIPTDFIQFSVATAGSGAATLACQADSQFWS